MSAMGAQAEESRAGLMTAEGSVPLAGVKVRGELTAAGARVEVQQRYVNTERQPVEAVYVFPLPEGAAVCGFAAAIGDRVLEGVLEERERAFERYDDAMIAGHGAFLLDQERPNVFTASVGNLLPGQEVVLRIRYVTPLGREGDAWRLMLPMTVAPRYVPLAEQARHQVGQPDGERVNPPVALDVPYGLDLAVDIALGAPPARISSPSHPVSIVLNGERAEVRLSSEDARLDRDVVLLVETGEPQQPSVQIEREADGTMTAAVTFLPRFETTRAPLEVIFVVDCSGSMRGDSIAETRRALRLCLRSLVDGDRFNIFRFGSRFESLFGRPEVYNERSFAAAERYIERMDADLGGTEMLAPLEAVLRQPRSDRLRQVVLLTDGEVSNEAAILELAARHAGDTRCFCFGIGAGPSEYLVRGLARAGGGEAEFIAPGERIEPKVLRQFARLTTPPVTNVRLEAGRLDFDQAPDPIPPLYDGDALTVYLRVRRGGTDQIRLCGEIAGRPFEFALPFDAATAGEGDLLGALYARAAIRALEEPVGEPARGSRQTRRRAEQRRRAIRELALRYGLMSSETSYVAIEVREEDQRADQPAELRRIPVNLTAGWGGTGRLTWLSALVPAAKGTRLFSPGVHRVLCSRACVALHDLRLEQRADGSFPLSDDALHDLLLEQRADGSFPLSDTVLAALGPNEALLDEWVRECEPDVLATLLVLHLLKERWPDRRREWQAAAAKAERWLAQQGDNNRRRAWFDATVVPLL